MLNWVLAFLLIALLGASLAFSGIAAMSGVMAKMLLFVALVVSLITVVLGVTRRT